MTEQCTYDCGARNTEACTTCFVRCVLERLAKEGSEIGSMAGPSGTGKSVKKRNAPAGTEAVERISRKNSVTLF